MVQVFEAGTPQPGQVLYCRVFDLAGCTGRDDSLVRLELRRDIRLHSINLFVKEV